MLKTSWSVILFLGLIWLSSQMHLKQDANATTLTNDSHIPQNDIPIIETPMKEPSVNHMDLPTRPPESNNETQPMPPKPADEKPVPLQGHPQIEHPKSNETKKPNEDAHAPPSNNTHSLVPNATHPTPPNTTHPTPPNTTHPTDNKTPPISPQNNTKPQSPPANNTNNQTKTNGQLKPNTLPPQKPAIQTCNRNTSPKSSINFNVYDVITHVYLNGKPLTQHYKKKENQDWSTTHSISLGLCEGDIIEIAGKNTLGKLIGMIATIHFINQKGIEKTYNTGSYWTCNGRKATILGINRSIGWSKMPLIDSQAEFIWNNISAKTGVEVSCFFKIPMN